MEILVLLFVAVGCLLLGATGIVWLLGWVKRQKALKIALFIVLFCLVNVPLTHYLSLKTIATDYKHGNYEGSPHWGYELQYDKWEGETELILWEGRSGFFLPTRYRMYLSYKYLTNFDPPTIKEARWLADDKAIYLKLSFISGDSAPQEESVSVIYDFQHGQMYAGGHHSPWLVNHQNKESDRSGSMMLTEAEFIQVLKDFEKENP